MGDEQGAASGAYGAVTVARSVESDITKARRVRLNKTVMEKFGPTDGCKQCAGCYHYVTSHSNACRARVEALMAADPEFLKMLESAQKRKEEYIAKLADAGAEPNSRDQGSELSEEPRAPSPLDATAAAGSSAVPVSGEAIGFSLALQGGDSRRRSEGILRFDV